MAKQTNTPEDWRILAERDLAVAEYLANNMVPIPTEIIAFHCQQATEKYRPSFVNIPSLCTIINYFSSQPRYDRGVNLSEEDMCLVLTHTKTIQDFLRKEIPELFQ